MRIFKITYNYREDGQSDTNIVIAPSPSEVFSLVFKKYGSFVDFSKGYEITEVDALQEDVILDPTID